MAPPGRKRGRGRGNATTSSSDLRLMRSARLQPNEPLHMTTRAAAASVTASVASAGSSASSVGEPSRSVGGDDIDGDRPAKIARISPTEGKPRSEHSSQELNQNVLPEQDVSQDSELAKANGTSNEDIADEVLNGHASDVSENEEDDNIKESVELGAANGGLKPPPETRGRKTSSVENRLSPSPSRALASEVKVKSADHQSPEADEAGGLLKRMPGRRRAPHPDINIEVDLRRQLELKVAYRAVVKALKPILAELAERAKRELENDRESHKNFSEYDEVIAELDYRLQQRMILLRAELREEETRLQKDLEARKDIIQRKFDYAVRDGRDDHLLRCENRFMSVLRDVEEEYDSDATDYEDGIVPNLYQVLLDGTRRRIPDGYDSRSRYFVETDRLWKNQVVRENFRKAQGRFDETSLVRKPKGFAVYDGKTRAIGLANENLLLLNDAALQADEDRKLAAMRLSTAPATSLHTLADATMNMGPLVRQTSKQWSDMSTQQRPNVVQGYQVAGPNGFIEETKTESATSSGNQRGTRRKRGGSKSRDIPHPGFSNHSNAQPSSETPASASAPYVPPPWPTTTTASSGPPVQAASPRTPAFVPFGSYPSQQKLDQGSPLQPPAPLPNLPPNLPPPPIQDAERVQPKPKTPTSFEPAQPNRRRRPGPRAFFAGDEANRLSRHPSSGHVWEPFTNTMGPPTYLPRYVKNTDIARQTSSASTSPITPVNSLPSASRSGNEWPGFSSNPAGGPPGQQPAFDSRMGQGSSFPSMTTPFAPSTGPPLARLSNAAEPPVAQSPAQRWGQVSSPDALSYEPRLAGPSPQLQSQHPPAMFPSPHGMGGYYPPNPSNNYYGSFPPPGPPGPPGQLPPSSRPNFNQPPGATAPLLPHPFYFQNTQGSPRQTSEQSPNQTAGAGSPQNTEPPKPPGWPQHDRGKPQRSHTPSGFPPLAPRTPLPPLRQEQMQIASQTGHQRILPATLDPNRRETSMSGGPPRNPNEPPPHSAFSQPVESPASAHAPPTPLTQGQQHGLYSAFSTAPQPPSHGGNPSQYPPHGSPHDQSQRQGQHQHHPAPPLHGPPPPPSAALRHQGLSHGRPEPQQQHSNPLQPPPPPSQQAPAHPPPQPPHQQTMGHHTSPSMSHQQHMQQPPRQPWQHYANILPAPQQQHESAAGRHERDGEVHEREREVERGATSHGADGTSGTSGKDKEWKFSRSRWG